MSYGEYAIEEKHRFINRVRFRNGNSLNFSAFQQLLEEKCEEYGIPVAFHMDTLKTGSIFKKQIEDVLIFFNPNHKSDYLWFLVRITRQGNVAFLDVFKCGGSDNFKHENTASFDSIGGLGRMMLNSLSGHKAKLREEETYYSILKTCLDEVLFD